MLLGIVLLVVSSSVLLPLVVQLKASEVACLYGSGVAAGLAGVMLLFVARLPLYRQGRFFAVGPRHLDQRHRQLCWLAHAFIAASLLLLWIVWLRTR